MSFNIFLNPTTLNFWLFIAFSIGIITGTDFNQPAIFIAGMASAGYWVFAFQKESRLLAAEISLIFLVVFCGGLWQISGAGRPAAQLINQDTNTILFKVTSFPSLGKANRLDAEIFQIDRSKTFLPLRVNDFSRQLSFGNCYVFNGRPFTRVLGARKLYFLNIPAKALVSKIPNSFLDRFNQKTTALLMGIFKNTLDDESYRFMASVFLGHREFLTPAEKIVFNNAGITHLLAISGSNIGLAAAGLFFILQLFGLNYRPRLLASIALLFIYTIITAASPPTLRATLMYSIIAVGFFLKRLVSPFNSFGLAGMVCLLINPNWLFDASFQLSFMAILALILGFQIFPLEASRNFIWNTLLSTFFSSLYVSLLLTPLISYYFGKIYLLTILYNLILIPFFSLILTLVLPLLILAPISWLTQPLGAIISLLVFIFYKTAYFLGSQKFSFVLYKMDLREILCWYGILGLGIFWLLYRRNRLKNPENENGQDNEFNQQFDN